MKLSTKSIKEKIKAHEVAKASEEKRAAELKKLEQAKSRQRAKFLNEVTEKVLGAALEGRSKVEIGIDCSDEIHEISHTLEERFLEIKELYYSDYVALQLENHLSSLYDEQIQATENILFQSSRLLRHMCEEIKKVYPELYEERMDYLIDLFSVIYKEDEALIDKITSLNLGCLELGDVIEEISESAISETYHQVIEDLSNIFKDTWQFQNIDEESTVYFIKWETLEDDDVLNYEPIDDYFNSLGLAWIASTHGQLFVAALESLVERKIGEDESLLKMRLYKFSSGYRIEMENGSEVYTLLDEIGLTRLFTKLGYKVKCLEADEEDAVDLEISWSSLI